MWRKHTPSLRTWSLRGNEVDLPYIPVVTSSKFCSIFGLFPHSCKLCVINVAHEWMNIRAKLPLVFITTSPPPPTSLQIYWIELSWKYGGRPERRKKSTKNKHTRSTANKRLRSRMLAFLTKNLWSTNKFNTCVQHCIHCSRLMVYWWESAIFYFCTICSWPAVV